MKSLLEMVTTAGILVGLVGSAATAAAQTPPPTVQTGPDAEIFVGDLFDLRNSGGRVTDDVEQGVALLSGMTRLAAGDRAPKLSLAIVHHTDCGLERIAAPGPRQALSQSTGIEPEVLETLAISDHQASLRADIERLRASDLVPAELEVSGHLYDVTSGKMTQIVSPELLKTE